MNRIVMTVIFVISVGSVVLGQLPTATVLGQVKDSSGAVVAGAKVTARNTGTTQTRTATTSDDGTYRLDALPVGNYEVTGEKTGFKTEVQSGLTLTVAQEAVVNFTIQVGEMSQTVSVTAEAPLVSTTTSSLGGLVDDQSMADLPLNGRNYNDLTLLQPGVMQQTGGLTTSLTLNATLYSSNGAPWRSNSYLLDGALMQNLIGADSASATGTTLGVDGILEYRVLTNAYSAEYGMTMGSIQTLVSKSGTNQFHGDAFDFLRNSLLDARNYFDLPPAVIGHRLPEFHRNNFGGAFGGPIKRNKTFFFGVYEGLSQLLGTTNTANVPPAGCHGTGGAVITVTACPLLAPVASVTIAPQMAPFMALYPLPNIGTSEYGFGFAQPTSEHYGQMRVDQSISSSDTLFGRYTVDQTAQTSPFSFPVFESILESRNQYVTLSENHIFSTSLLNTARFSFSRTNEELGEAQLISGPQYQILPGEPMGLMSINGLTNIGNNSSAPRIFKQNIFSWSDDLDYTRGRHSLKFGLIINHLQDYITGAGGLKGQAQFAGVAQFLTAQLQSFNDNGPGSFVDRTFHFNTMGFYAQDDWRVTPRLTLNLGMRYEPITTPWETQGIAASWRNPATDPSTTIGNPLFLNPSFRNLSPRFGFAWDVTGNGHTAVRGGFAVLYDVNDWGSALSAATSYDPPFDSTLTITSGTLTIPFTIPPGAAGSTSAFRGPIYHEAQPHMLSYNLTLERQLPGSMGLSVAYAGSSGINIMQLNEGNPEIPNGVPSGGICVKPPASTSINLTSQIDGQATSCYLASAPRRNPSFSSTIPIVAGGNSIYSAMEVMLTKRLSKGLQLQSSYTWSRLIDDTQGEQGADDNGPFAVEGSDPLHERVNRGPADFDVTNNWRLNAIYHLPNFTSSTGFLGKLENGWWTSGIYSFQSGYPFTVFLAANRSLTNEVIGTSEPTERADIVPGRVNSNMTHGVSAGCGTGAARAAGGTAIAAGTALGTPSLWYDPCAYYMQPQGFIGAEGRNYLRGPGLSNLNFSVVKDTAVRFLGEGGKVEFRAEFFNLFNHTNFALPQTAADTVYTGTCGGVITACGALGQGGTVLNPTGAAGTLTATNATSRQIQFGLKILF